MLNWMDVNRTFNELELFRREMDRLFSDAVQGELRGSLSQASGRVGADLRTTEEAFVLSVDVPGIDPGDIDLQITRDGVTLRAERRLEAPEGYATHRQERSSWRLSRSWNLPMPIIGFP